MATMATALEQYLRILRRTEGFGGRVEVATGIARAVLARLAGRRGALHVRRSVIVREGDVRWFVPPWDNAFASAAPGEANSPVVPEMLRRLGESPRSTLVDIGANLGYVCMTAAHRFPAKRVVAVEPVPWLADALQRTARLNAFTNVTVLPRAAADVPAIDLAIPRLRGVWLSTLSSGAGRMSGEADRVPREVVRVEAAPLDALLASAGVAPGDVAVVKIDVEGAEASVLRTAPALLAAHPPVLFEAWDAALRAEVEGVLRGHGYRRFEPIDESNFAATA